MKYTKVTIFWKCNRATRHKICNRFGINHEYVNVGGETPTAILTEDLPLLQECENRNFLKIRNKRQSS